jgi:transposase-like protein
MKRVKGLGALPMRWTNDDIHCPWCGHTTWRIQYHKYMDLPVGEARCELCKREYKIIKKIRQHKQYRSPQDKLNVVPLKYFTYVIYHTVKVKKK